MTGKRMFRGACLAVAILIGLLPGALAAREIYGGEEKAVPGVLYPYDSSGVCGLIDLEGHIYAQDGYYEIYAVVSDAGERRFVGISQSGGEMRCYLLDERGERLTDGACYWMSATSGGLIFYSPEGRNGLYGWDGEILIEPVYDELISAGDGTYLGVMNDDWELRTDEADLIRPGEPVERIRLGDGDVMTLYGDDDPLISASTYDGENTLSGYLDATGRWKIPPIYEYTLWFTGNYAVASLQGRVGLIDREGKAALPFDYDDVEIEQALSGRTMLGALKDNELTVYALDEASDSFSEVFRAGDVEYFWFNRNGAVIARGASVDQNRVYTFDGRLVYVSSDDEKDLSVINEDLFCVSDFGDNTYTLIDGRGHELAGGTGMLSYVLGEDGVYALRVCVSERIDRGDGDMIFDWNRARYGLYDLQGRELLEPKYDYISPICEGYFAVSRGPWHGVVGPDGEWIVRQSNYMTLMD